MEYGVQTHNKFAFLDEDVSDPEETLTKAEEEKKKAAANPPEKKGTKSTVVTKAPAATVPAKEVEKKDNDGGQPKQPAKFRNDRGGGASNRDRDTRDGGRGGGPPRPRRPQQNAQREGFDSQNEREKRMPNGRPPQNNEYNKEDGRPARRGPPRGGGGGGQRGGYGGGARSGGQRRSRNEQQEENKTDDSKPKENENNEDKSAAENETNEVTDGQKVNDENVDNTGGEEKKGEQEEEDQVPRGKTYEEYKAELNQKQIEAVQFNTRKPGEGGDDKIYQKLVPLKKPDNKNKSENVPEETTQQHKEKREKTLSIDVAFVDKRFSGGPTRPGFGGTDRNERPPPRGDRERGGDYRQGQGGDRQGHRGGGGQGRGGGQGGGGGRGGGPPRNNNYGPGAAGPSNRRAPNKQGGDFTLENDQFPALGAK